LTLLSFPDDHVVTSSDAARALKRLGGKGDDVVAFMGDATVEALAALRDAGARTFTLRSFGWTDEGYASVRQPLSHGRDRGPGGLPK
jgi:ABC-type sugar transport system substrate-binding protein